MERAKQRKSDEEWLREFVRQYPCAPCFIRLVTVLRNKNSVWVLILFR